MHLYLSFFLYMAFRRTVKLTWHRPHRMSVRGVSVIHCQAITRDFLSSTLADGTDVAAMEAEKPEGNNKTGLTSRVRVKWAVQAA
jgi:hypothetical protein